MIEKRKHARKPVDLEASIFIEGLAEAIEGQVCDLSIGGAFVRANLELPFGTAIEIQIMFPPPAGPMTLPAVVRWAQDDGLGLQFGLLGARETHAIAVAITPHR